MAALRKPAFWVLLAVTGVAAFLPLVLKAPSMREELFLVFLYVVLAANLNLLLGYTGYVNFGHIVFFGVGGYIGLFLITALGMHLIPAAGIAGLVTAAAAYLLGRAVLHLRGAYFAIATIGVNEAVRALAGNLDFLGGASGMFLNFSVYRDYGGPAGALNMAYLLVATLAAVSLALGWVVKRSKFGLALLAIRENEDAALGLGIDAQQMKSRVYATSAFLPAMAGAAFFFKNGNVVPDTAFSLGTSIESIVMVMLGGFGSPVGPAVGALIYERIRGTLLTSALFRDLHIVIAGALLLVIVLFATRGVVGLLEQRFPRFRKAVA